MATKGLVIWQVTKKIADKVVVQPFDLHIEPGEVVALCGGNGAGKSTILRMIVGILSPTSGTISLHSKTYAEHRVEYLQQIGYMPDHFNFASGLTARETIRFYAALRGKSSEAADTALRAVGLEEAKNKRVTQFSKGMQQRLLFAQAILAKPSLVVLDEPTNGLDPYWMDAFVDLVRELKQAGQSVLFSTHQLQVADAVADRAIFLMDGHVVRDSPIQEYRREYGANGLYAAFSELFAPSLRSGGPSVSSQRRR